MFLFTRFLTALLHFVLSALLVVAAQRGAVFPASAVAAAGKAPAPEPARTCCWPAAAAAAVLRVHLAGQNAGAVVLTTLVMERWP